MHIKNSVWFGVAVACLGGAEARAQSEAGHIERHVRVEVLRGAAEPGTPGQPMTWFGMGQGPADFDIVTAPIMFEGPAVQGAPYAADAVTEVTQTLADGNRITRKNTASIYRDGMGRTRREQSLTAIGPLVHNPDDLRHVSLNDPQRGVSYQLEPGTKIARKLTLPKRNLQGFTEARGEANVVFDMPIPPPPSGGERVMFFGASRAGAVDAPKTESLGTQTIEGVSAEGTRTTLTIAAGQIGNERPIEIVSERWFSPELKVLVMSRQSDPRFGETIYRLTGIVLGEPAASLFDVPADYKVEEGGMPGMRARGIRQIERREK